MILVAKNSARGGSPANSSYSTVGSSQDPIILSDDEHVGAESETDYNDLDVDLGAKSDSDSSHVAGSELADGDGFGSETPHISDRPGSASSGHGPITHQASKLRVNTDITQGTTSYDNLDATKELEGEGFDIFAEEDGDGDDDTRSAKGRTLSAVSNKNPASDSNISRLQDGRPDDTQSPQLGLAAVSPHQSDLKNDHLSKQRRRGAQSRALITAPNQERELRDISLEIVDDGNTDDSDDGDYADESDAAGSKIGGRPRPRKRARRTKDTEDNDVAAPFTHSLGTSYQTIAVTSSGGMLESEEIPIHGYFTLKSIESKVVYCLTFSQESLPRPQDRGQRQGTTTNLGEPQSVAPVADPNHQWGIRKIIDQKMVGRERHYRVEWKDTWVPESELSGAKELVDAFMANDGSGGGRRPLKRGRPATGQPSAQGDKGPKRRRGRPRKQA